MQMNSVGNVFCIRTDSNGKTLHEKNNIIEELDLLEGI